MAQPSLCSQVLLLRRRWHHMQSFETRGPLHTADVGRVTQGWGGWGLPWRMGRGSPDRAGPPGSWPPSHAADAYARRTAVLQGAAGGTLPYPMQLRALTFKEARVTCCPQAFALIGLLHVTDYPISFVSKAHPKTLVLSSAVESRCLCPSMEHLSVLLGFVAQRQRGRHVFSGVVLVPIHVTRELQNITRPSLPVLKVDPDAYDMGPKFARGRSRKTGNGPTLWSAKDAMAQN